MGLTSYTLRLSQISRDQPALADCAQDKGWAPTGDQADQDTNGEAVSLIIKSIGRSHRLPGFVAWLYDLGKLLHLSQFPH